MTTHEDRVWETISQAGVGMLTTHFPGGLRSRPLEPRPDREAGLIWFVTDARSGKGEEIASDENVCFVVIDHKANAYLSLTGAAEVQRDSAKAREIWHSTDDVWWPQGPADPNVRVIRFTPHVAELWDGPASQLVAAFEFAKWRLTGAAPKLGEKRKVTVPFSSE
jgi:general stress protein 26